MKTEDIISGVDKYVLGTYSRIPLTIKKGEGSWVWDNDGNKYLDFTTGIAVNNLGHSHPGLTEVIREQAGNILGTDTLIGVIEGDQAKHGCRHGQHDVPANNTQGKNRESIREKLASGSELQPATHHESRTLGSNRAYSTSVRMMVMI